MTMWIHSGLTLFGVALGVCHAAGIWQSAKHHTAASAVVGLTRLFAVGLALAITAMLGGILPTAAGWALGFLATIATVAAKTPHHRQKRATE